MNQPESPSVGEPMNQVLPTPDREILRLSRLYTLTHIGQDEETEEAVLRFEFKYEELPEEEEPQFFVLRMPPTMAEEYGFTVGMEHTIDIAVTV